MRANNTILHREIRLSWFYKPINHHTRRGAAVMETTPFDCADSGHPGYPMAAARIMVLASYSGLKPFQLPRSIPTASQCSVMWSAIQNLPLQSGSRAWCHHGTAAAVAESSSLRKSRCTTGDGWQGSRYPIPGAHAE